MRLQSSLRRSDRHTGSFSSAKPRPLHYLISEPGQNQFTRLRRKDIHICQQGLEIDGTGQKRIQRNSCFDAPYQKNEPHLLFDQRK